MPDIDPVIFEFHARVNGYLADINRTTRTVDQKIGLQERRIKSLETQMAKSSTAISGHLRGLAGTLATYFTGRELTGLIDNFTRLQNQLRVAGLEGDALAKVQERLFEVANRYGVAVNSLSELYGKAAQAQRDLNATTGDLLQITEATAQALKITGTSTVQASGAILGLTQALSSGIVRAEEFNQINEGGLRPLLQVVAATDKWNGSVAKLRNAIVEGQVTSDEFFQAILAGSEMLEQQAAKATLTLEGAFTALQNRLVQLIGGAADAHGATQALASAVQALADNLEDILPILAIIGAAIGGRMAAALVRMSGAATAGSAAVFALRARMAGAATSAEALTFAGRGVAGVFGGPVGLAVTALTLGLGYLIATTENAEDRLNRLSDAASRAEKEADDLEQRLRDAGVAIADTGTAADRTSSKVDGLAGAFVRAKNKAFELVDALNKLGLARIANRLGEIREERAQIRRDAVTRASTLGQTRTGDAYAVQGRARPDRFAASDAASLAQLAKEEAALNRQAIAIAKGVAAGVDVTSPTSISGTPAASTASGSGRKGSARGSSGPTAAELNARYRDEVDRLQSEELRAKFDLATNAEDRAELARKILSLERDERLRQIASERDYTAEQREAMEAAIHRLYGGDGIVDGQGNIIAEGRPGLLMQQVMRDLMEREADLANDMLARQAGTLEAWADLETNTQERNRLERDALAIHQQIERNLLDQEIASGQVADAERAQAELASLQAAARVRLSRNQMTPGQRYAFDLRTSAENVNEAVEAIQVRGLDSLNDGLVDAVMGVKSLGDVFKNVADQIIADLLRIAIQRSIIGPLADAIFGGIGAAGGGGPIDLLAGTPYAGGRASGGPVAPGRLYRVNEGASPGRVEAFVPNVGGDIIPLGRMNAAMAGAPVSQSINVTVNARDAVLTHTVREWVAQGVQIATQAGSQIGAKQAEARMASRSRRRIPG
ncbi:hypothetical protein GCM10011371_08350 [Novosphingobium marinum]|uniref:Tape measure domain-containing protein n=1 Tax=Novosphingobium marinum TaxID=1514948 RepID=A0A7Y9XWC3_9SPHN|nr:tape measure protein [Novosphingobium marinum]NYH94523.1 tape measure domain-containing protein [Novosphingobium marinum]GGC22994.1 hypothetical protein GCM10011371_08350 [Novosphingobium marinum]